MLKLIYGPPQSGKTQTSDSLLIDELKKGSSVTLIVPEQEVIGTENRIYDKAIAERVVTERLTVVSFGRLANLAFRKHGGIEYNNIGEGGKLILIYRIIDILTPLLKVYKNASDRSLVELMLSVCSELKHFSVLPSALINASENAAKQTLRDKLTDIALIYTMYCAELASVQTDSADDIDRLAEIYRTEKPSKDEIFYIDSFNGFTTAELRVIEALIRSCNVTVTVNKPKESGKLGFKTVEKTERQLLACAEKAGADVIKATELFENEAPENEFQLIRDRLYDFSYTSPEGFSSPNVTLAACSDPFAQAEFIAINICKLIREGARYRDIAVITRNADRYDGVLDVTFEKYGIPLFLSKRDRITRTSIYKSVSAALGIISEGYRTEDIMAYIKSGVCNFSMREIDLIESYVSLWSIDGKRWTEDNEWGMNPAGFTDSINADSAKTLAEINDIRRRIILPLTELAEDVKNVTVKEGCSAIYKFITKSGIINYYAESDDASDVTAYNTFISLIDTLYTVGDDIPASPSILSSLLYLMAKNTDFGSIPATLDRVTAGDASIIRCNGVKHVFLTDCENGVFPASVTDDSFFSDAEKKFLSEQGVEISPRVDEKNDLEAFYFLRSACGATRTLTATLCSHGSNTYYSVGFQRLTALFPANKVISYPSGVSQTDKIQTKATLSEILRSMKDSPLYPTVKEVASELDIDVILSEIPIADPLVTVSSELAEEIFGGDLHMSHTSFEKYVKCPFSYFCTYILKLREKKYNFFMASDMGTHIHRILEMAINALFNDGKKNTGGVREITETDVISEVEKATKDVVSKILGNDTSNEGKRFEALLNRLKRTLTIIASNVVSEFKSSDFRPKFFELKIGKGDGDIPALDIVMDDGAHIKISGVIDRVDVYEDGEKTYVRIVDYKTGSHEHSINNIKFGLDTQMLLYLFSLWKSGSTEFKRLLGNENTVILPAGVLYQSARLPITKQATPATEEKSLKNAESKLIRSGVLLNDPVVLNAMEHGLDGRFLPVRMEKEQLKASKNVLVSREGFDELLTTVEDVLKSFGQKMKSGNACASPIKKKDAQACKYCQLYPICRSKNVADNEEGGD